MKPESMETANERARILQKVCLYLSIGLMLLLGLVAYMSTVTGNLEEKAVLLQAEGDQYRKEALSNKAKADSLVPIIQQATSKADSLMAVVRENEKNYLKLDKKYDEKFKEIDAYRVSDMQRYFDERFGTR